MKTLPIVLLFVPILSIADVPILFGTNQFTFCFEDTTLDSETQTSLASCLANFIQPWTNTPVFFQDGLSGRIAFTYMNRPNLGGENFFPERIRRNSTNEIYSIIIDKQLSDKYVEGTALLSGKSEQLTALWAFLSYLNSDDVWTTSDETAVEKFHNGAAMAAQIPPPYSMHDYWTNEVARYHYHMPTPWGFYEWPLDGEVRGAFTVEVPVSENNASVSNGLVFRTEVILSWIGGQWKFNPIPW